MLALAAREAGIVCIDARGTRAGGKDLATTTSRALAQQIGWVRAAAGSRFDAPELHLLVYTMAVTEHRRQAAERISQFNASLPPEIIVNAPMPPDEVLASPRVLIGTAEQIVEQLQTLREQNVQAPLPIEYFPSLCSRACADSVLP